MPLAETIDGGVVGTIKFPDTGEMVEVKYAPSPYPKRPARQSAKFCLKHKQVNQVRFIVVEGPLDELESRKDKGGRTVTTRGSRNSHWFLWRLLGLGYFITPIPGKWYMIEESSSCSLCCEQFKDNALKRHEKTYRRLMGKLGFWSLMFKARMWPKKYTFILVKEKII